MKQKFTIPDRLPSMNDILRAKGNTKYSGNYNKMKKNQEAIIGWMIREAKLKPMAWASITFEWIEKDRRRDLDNIAAGKKFILDALVDCGILPGDGRGQVVRFIDEFPQPEKDKPRIIVHLEGEPV